MNYCPQCGHGLEAGIRFCPSCGRAVADGPAGADPAPPAPDAEKPGLRRVSPALLFLVLAGVILIAAGLLLDGDGAPASAPAAGIPFPDVPRVGLSEAKEAFDGGDAVFVDVRERSDYETGHVPGALSIPLGDSGMDGAFRQLPLLAQIITYCT